MKPFKYGKIIRRKSLTHLLEHNDPDVAIKTTPLNNEQTNHYLFEKLDEEVQECHDATSNDELATECGDVLEVLQTICSHSNIAWTDVEGAQKKKIEERGKLAADQYVHHVTLPTSHHLYDYFLERPEKYPEVDAKTGYSAMWPQFLKELLSFQWLTQATVLSYTTLFILMPTMAFLVNLLINIGIDMGNQDLWLLTLSRDLPSDTQKNLLSWWDQIKSSIDNSSGWIIFSLLITQWITSLLIQRSLQSFWPKQNSMWYHLPKLLTSLFWIFWAFGLQTILIIGGWITSLFDHLAPSFVIAMWTMFVHFIASWILFSGVLWFSAPIKKPLKVWRVGLIMSLSFFIVNHVVSWFIEHSFTLSLTFGSFSFMPTLMIWLECIWIIVVLGVIGLSCYNR